MLRRLVCRGDRVAEVSSRLRQVSVLLALLLNALLAVPLAANQTCSQQSSILGGLDPGDGAASLHGRQSSNDSAREDGGEDGDADDPVLRPVSATVSSLTRADEPSSIRRAWQAQQARRANQARAPPSL
jgi:hypothetical protein